MTHSNWITEGEFHKEIIYKSLSRLQKNQQRIVVSQYKCHQGVTTSSRREDAEGLLEPEESMMTIEEGYPIGAVFLKEEPTRQPNEVIQVGGSLRYK